MGSRVRVELSEVRAELDAFVTQLCRLVTGRPDLRVRLDVRDQHGPRGFPGRRLLIGVDDQASRILIGTAGSAASALRCLIKSHALTVLRYGGDLDVRIVKPSYADFTDSAS